MKAPIWLLTLGLLLTAHGALSEEPDPVVIVLSWDGLRHDFLEIHDADEQLKALRRVAAEGIRADRLTPVFPSNTFPGNVSMATGTYPDRHGIVDNRFYDREQGLYHYSADANWLQAEPLWIAAERQGIPSATYFWVGSESDWRGQGTRYRIAPFDGDRPEAEKVDQILAWLRLPAGERPRLIMSYWAGTDRVSHDFGPLGRRVKAQLAEQDTQLGRLLAGLDAMNAWPYTTLLLVSDHGATETGAYLDLRGALADRDISARVLGSPVAHVFLDNPQQLEAAKAAILSLGPVQVHQGSQLPDELRMRHPTRTGDLVVVTEPPYVLARPGGLKGALVAVLSAFGWAFGGHGYDPSLPDMGAVFMAMGRGVEPGYELARVHQIDVAPTVASLLGIDPPRQAEGRPVPGIFVPTGTATSSTPRVLGQKR